MSQEDLTRFLEAVRQDSSLQEKLQAEGADPVAIAKEAGFSVTQAELIRAHASRIQTLSDEELESAAGGTLVVFAGIVVGGVVGDIAYAYKATD
jgi:predicted ribosomally synthesized peptide with nif11-like leader